MNKFPKTIAELLRFQKGVWKQIKTIKEAGEDLSQWISCCADSVEAYEAFIKLIASGKADFFCLRKQAKELLKKHKL